MFYKTQGANPIINPGIVNPGQKYYPLMNNFLYFFLSILSFWSIRSGISMIKQINNKFLQVTAVIVLISLCILFHMTIRLITRWINQLVYIVSKERYAYKIKREKKVKLSGEDYLINVFQNKYFYDEENLETVLNLYRKIYHSQSGYFLKFLLYGKSGMGKTLVMQEIAKAGNCGALFLNLSSLMEIEDPKKTDMNMEINKIEDFFKYSKKKNYFIVFENLEIFLERRNYNFISLKKDDEKRILMNIISIWINYWLSVLSGSKVTIIILTDIIPRTIDTANSRRLQEIFTLQPPNLIEKKNLLKRVLKNYSIDYDLEDTIEYISDNIEKFSFRDIANFLQSLEFYSINNYISMDLITVILKDFQGIKRKMLEMKVKNKSQSFLEKNKKRKNLINLLGKY